MGALIWPEAPKEASKYRAVLEVIEKTRANIDEAADIHDNYFNSNTYIDRSNAIYGEFYDTYSGRVNDWVKSGKKIRFDFEKFQMGRDLLQFYAEEQYEIWTERIGLRYPDPPPSPTNSPK
jgi:hypothetical protein